MQIVNGKWVDNFENPVDNFNFNQFKEVSENVTALYGGNITYERIKLVGSLKSLNGKQEKIIANLLQDHELIAKLSGL
jgi:hypothetical protein